MEIRRLFDQGQRISGKHCSVIWEVGDSFRFAVFLSRRHGKAAQRNRVKRLYREAIRLNRQLLTRPVRIGVLPDAAIEQPGFSEISEELHRIFGLIDAQQQ